MTGRDRGEAGSAAAGAGDGFGRRAAARGMPVLFDLLSGSLRDGSISREEIRRAVDAFAWELVGRMTEGAPWHAEPEVQKALDRRAARV